VVERDVDDNSDDWLQLLRSASVQVDIHRRVNVCSLAAHCTAVTKQQTHSKLGLRYAHKITATTQPTLFIFFRIHIYKKITRQPLRYIPSASATYRLRKIHSPSADPKYFADLDPQVDPSAIRTSLVTTKCSINRLHGSNFKYAK